MHVYVRRLENVKNVIIDTKLGIVVKYYEQQQILDFTVSQNTMASTMYYQRFVKCLSLKEK